MEKIFSTKRPDVIIGFKMTEHEFKELDNDYLGLCLACGEVNDSCEPDARNYTCENCEKEKVFGSSEIMMMGKIAFI